MIREVSGDAQTLPVRCNCTEVDGQRIGDDHGQSRRFEFRLQPAGQVAIDLDGGQVVDALEQRARHRAPTGTDLDQRIARLGSDGIDDPRYVMPVDEKILRKALARCVQHSWLGWEVDFAIRRVDALE